MKTNSWYYNKLFDTKYLNLTSKKKFVDEIFDMFKNSYFKWTYKNGEFEYESLYETLSLIPSASNFNKIPTTNHKTSNQLYSELLEEKELIEKIFNKIDIYLPILKKDEDILLIYYYHCLNGLSHKQMYNKGLYKYKKTKFYQDKDKIYDIVIRALNI